MSSTRGLVRTLLLINKFYYCSRQRKNSYKGDFIKGRLGQISYFDVSEGRALGIAPTVKS